MPIANTTSILSRVISTAHTPAASEVASQVNPDRLVWGADDGGTRAWLDGQPLYSGEPLEVFIDGEWRRARLEATPTGDGAHVPVIHLGTQPIGIPHKDLPCRRVR